MYKIYVYIDIYVEILFSILRYRSLFAVRFKKAKGAIRTAVKKMVDFIFFFIFSLFTFRVLRMFCRIRDFFLLLADLMMRTFSIYVLFPLILMRGIKEFALCIYPYGWVFIFSDILLICLLLEFYQQFYSKKWAVEFILQSIKIILPKKKRKKGIDGDCTVPYIS